MSLRFSNRIMQVKPSATIGVSMKAAALRAAGHDIISLGAGEPDFDTPQHIKEAAIQAIQDGDTKYTAVDGTAELKQAIQHKFQRDNGLEFDASQIIVSAGAKQAVFNALLALLNPGDEVVIPAPYWVSYPDMVKLGDGQPVILHTGMEQAFKINPKQLESSLTEKTRALIINSPSNPTGKVYSAKELSALGEILQQYPKVAILCDDIYEPIYWGSEPFNSLLSVCPELAERTLIINGVSKAYAMTGWRIGYAAGPEHLIKQMRKLQSQSTSNACSISQAASVAALNGPQDCVQQMCSAFQQRYKYVHQAFNQLPGITCAASEGAFYALPDFSQAIDQLPAVQDDTQLAEWLLENAGVAMVPGSAFGAPGHLRLSYATSLETLQQAVARLAKALPGS